MENLNQELTINFDKAEFKDLLIHQIANHMQQHWNTNEVIELFLNSSYSFVEAHNTKAQIAALLMETHKMALKNELNLVA